MDVVRSWHYWCHWWPHWIVWGEVLEEEDGTLCAGFRIFSSVQTQALISDCSFLRSSDGSLCAARTAPFSSCSSSLSPSLSHCVLDSSILAYSQCTCKIFKIAQLNSKHRYSAILIKRREYKYLIIFHHIDY